jgi:hypothetical protein
MASKRKRKIGHQQFVSVRVRLWQAAQRGKLDDLREIMLLVPFIDVLHSIRRRSRNAPFVNAYIAALNVAALNDHAGCVTALVAALAEKRMTLRDKCGKMPLVRALSRAASIGSIKAMRCLLDAGALTHRDSTFRKIHNLGNDVPHSSMRFGAFETPFLWAVRGKQTDALRLLIDAKTNVNDRVYMSAKLLGTESAHCWLWLYVPLTLTENTALIGSRSGVMRLAHAKADLQHEFDECHTHLKELEEEHDQEQAHEEEEELEEEEKDEVAQDNAEREKHMQSRVKILRLLASCLTSKEPAGLVPCIAARIEARIKARPAANQNLHRNLNQNPNLNQNLNQNQTPYENQNLYQNQTPYENLISNQISNVHRMLFHWMD